MAPPTVGQRLNGFMDAHGFDLEDLIGLSLEDFKKFLLDPEFDVENVEIPFLVRDWKNTKKALTSAPIQAEAVTSAPRKAETITSAPVKAETITSAPEDKTIIIIIDSDSDSDSEDNQKPAAVTPDMIRSELNSSSDDVDSEENQKPAAVTPDMIRSELNSSSDDVDSEENQKPAAVTPDKIRSELNSSSEDVTDSEANSKGKSCLQLPGGTTNLSGVDVPRLQQGLILGLQRLVEGFGDAGPTTEENECDTEISTTGEEQEEAPSQGSSPPRTRVQRRTVRARESEDATCIESIEEPVVSRGRHPEENRTSEVATLDELGKQATIESVSDPPLKRRHVDIGFRITQRQTPLERRQVDLDFRIAQRQTHRTRVQSRTARAEALEDAACTEVTEEPVVSDDQHQEENRTSEAATLDEFEEQPTIDHVSDPPLKRRKVDIDREETRKYGERYLLGRHHPRGVGRLGGSVQEMFPNPREDHPRLTELGDIKVATLHDLWQPHGPQYAGQPAAIIGTVPDREKPFAVFMRRSRTSRDRYATTAGRLLGWEYCGNYRLKKDNEVGMWASANDSAPVSKQRKVLDMIKQRRANGKTLIWWRSTVNEALSEEEQKVKEALPEDEQKRRGEVLATDQSSNKPNTTRAKNQSPPDQEHLVQCRSSTQDKRKNPRESMGARAKALGCYRDMPLDELAESLVELDEFYQDDVILFDKYDEDVYNYVKKGITNKDKYGKNAENGNNCKASGWYEFLDQQPGW